MPHPESDTLRLFALASSRYMGERIGSALGIALHEHEERDFEDGEHKTRPLVSVRRKDVFVISSLYGDATLSPNDKLCRLLFFISALKDASAHRVVAVVPYLCYTRKDRRTQLRDPVTMRYVAGLFESAGVDQVVTLDVHNVAAFQNAFRCPTDHLEARSLFAAYLAPLLRDKETVVASPDVGGIKRADLFRDTLGEALERELPPVVFMEKKRRNTVVSGETLYGDVADRVVVLIDDIISTGTTLLRAAQACREAGARRVYAAATHGHFVERARDVVADPVLDKVIVTDTIPPFRLPPDLVREKVVVLDTAILFAHAIEAIHTGTSMARWEPTRAS